MKSWILGCGLVCLFATTVTAAPIYYLEPLEVTAFTAGDPTLRTWRREAITATGVTDAAGVLQILAGITAADTERTGQMRALIFVDGIPLSESFAATDLSLLPAAEIEKIELSRTPGLGRQHGEAVVRLTLCPTSHKVATVGMGNIDRRKFLWSQQEAEWALRFGYEHWGRINRINRPQIFRTREIAKFYNYPERKKYTAEISYEKGNWYWQTKYRQDYRAKESIYAYKPVPVIYDDQERTRRQWENNLQYRHGDWRIRFRQRQLNSHTEHQYFDYDGLYSSELIAVLPDLYRRRIRDAQLSLDIRYEHAYTFANVVARLNTEHNRYRIKTENRPAFNYATGRFEGYREPVNDVFSRQLYRGYLGLRKEWDEHILAAGVSDLRTANSPGREFHDQIYRIQYRYRPSETLYWYALYRESFDVPSMEDLYGEGAEDQPAPLVASKGRHYELGASYTRGDVIWKAFFFYDKVKNDIRYKVNLRNDLFAVNAHTENKGFTLQAEGEYEPWNYALSLTFQDPEFYEVMKPERGWRREYGHVSVNANLRYRHGKWAAGLSAQYLGRRILSTYQEDVRPLLTTRLNLRYKVNADYELFFEMENIGNRRDVISHLSTRYYSHPRNWLLGLSYSF